MLLADTVEKRIVTDSELKERYAASRPYGEWLDANLVKLRELPIPNKKVPIHTQETRDRLYKAFGYTYEDVRSVILPMARTGAEPTASMGADIPLAVLSEKHQPLFSYFKQLFAQVTNPPIDAIREEIVTDTTVYVGSDGNLLEDSPENCRVLEIHNPILSGVDMLKIRSMDKPGFKVETVSILYYKNTPLERAIDRMFIACDRAYRNGANIIILSDRGVDENHVAIPSLLAVSAMEQYLIRTKKRTAPPSAPSSRGKTASCIPPTPLPRRGRPSRPCAPCMSAASSIRSSSRARPQTCSPSSRRATSAWSSANGGSPKTRSAPALSPNR